MERWQSGWFIMWFSLAKMALKTGANVYSNKQKQKEAMSQAALFNCRKDG